MDRVSKAERELVRKMQRQTNADRIRAMTDKELAEFVNDLFYGLNENPGMCDVCDHDSI